MFIDNFEWEGVQLQKKNEFNRFLLRLAFYFFYFQLCLALWTEKSEGKEKEKKIS